MSFLFAAIFALLLAALLYHRSRPELSRGRLFLLCALRFVALFILLIVLLSPVLHFFSTRKNAPQILVLKDESLSMDISREGKSKSKALKEPLNTLKRKYQDAGYRILEYSFADGIDGERSNSLLGKSLAEISKKEDFRNISSVLLASDGWLRDEDFKQVSRLGYPIYALADTTRYSSGDLAIRELQANRYAYRNENTFIRAKVAATGYSGQAKVHLYLGQQRISSQTLKLEDNVEQIVEFMHRFPQLGFFNYRVELEALDKEQSLGNNVYPGAIEVLAEKELIAVLSDAPGWDNKFILDAIATNPRWQSVSYQVRNGVAYRGEEMATLSDNERPAVIVILNNGNLRLDPSLRRYIEDRLKSGAGLLYQGLPLSELADYLPFTRSNLTSPYQGFVQLQPAADMYPMLSQLGLEQAKLPPLDYYYCNPAPGSELLGVMNNPQKSPAIAIKLQGKNRALAFSFLNLWRWQMQRAESGYQKMMVNILTWLSNKALGSYSAIYKSSYLQGEEVLLSLRAEDDIRSHDLDKNPRISIYDAEGKLLEQDFMTSSGDEYRYTSKLTEPGNYRFEIREADSEKSSKGSFAISEISAEERDFDFNLPLLGYLAQTTRGKLISLEDAALHNPLPPVIGEEILKREYNLYKQWYIITLFILAFCLELFFRRRWGLL
ncbi:MAG: hypothetical protein PHQ78_00150 [Candidatus Cloacimonetes bacterium]|nr:hypothetical protein [Candidatus Cloacimonadota bacterium]MDD4559140.1 hypothetical protein [Candidatus Cloacimonadota bacterium]